MTQSMAIELDQDLQSLMSIFQILRASEQDRNQAMYLQSSIDLIKTAISRLTDLLAGTSTLREANVYLYVNSLNKGLIEIGASWQDDQRISAAITSITDKAYRYYKMCR